MTVFPGREGQSTRLTERLPDTRRSRACRVGGDSRVTAAVAFLLAVKCCGMSRARCAATRMREDSQ